MRHDEVQAALAAKHKPDSLLERIAGYSGRPSGEGGAVDLSLAAGGRRQRGDVPPPDIRGLVHEFFQTDNYSRYSFLREPGRLGPTFAALDDAARLELFRTLLPGLVPTVESAWSTLARRPYQVGLTRKPFRCPRSAQTLADVRGRWLLHVAELLGDYEGDIVWVAEWAAYLAGWSGGTDLGWLFAGAIDAGGAVGDEVFEILKASAAGEHETGEMGRHVTQALLSCGRPEAWAFVERMLLAAQRQEGLRQTILESVDESHPDAFRRMLRLIREENLSRFSSVVRAADTWFGFLWDGASAVKVDQILDRVLLFLDDPAACTAALDEKDAETVYLALWCQAFEDVDTAVESATRLLTSDAIEIRFVATHLLTQATWTSALSPLVGMLADDDLRVAARALDAFGEDVTQWVDGAGLVDGLERLIGRLSKRSQTLEGIVWPWWSRKLERPQVAAAMAANAGAVAPDRMLPFIPDLDPDGRERFVRRLAGVPGRWQVRDDDAPRPPLTGAARRTVLELLGDASPDVREAAFEAMEAAPLEEDEIDRLIELLGRKSGDLRSHCLVRLRALDDDGLLAAADRLLGDRAEQRRHAGLELLRDAAEAGRAVEAVRERAAAYRAAHEALSEIERTHLDAVLGSSGDVASRDDALGLVDPATLRTWPEARPIGVEVDTAGARASLEALASLILEHQREEVDDGSGDCVLLLEAGMWGPGSPGAERAPIPLAEVWKEWNRTRPAELRDPDGLELLRALMQDRQAGAWKQPAVEEVLGLARWGGGGWFLVGLLQWCIAWDPPEGGLDFLLDGLEDALAALTPDDYAILRELAEADSPFMRRIPTNQEALQELGMRVGRAGEWLGTVRWWMERFPSSATPERSSRLFGLLWQFKVRSGGFGELRITLADFLAAWRAGAAGTDEFVFLLAGPWGRGEREWLLREVSSRRIPAELEPFPELVEAVERCRARIVEVEAARGDRETAASRLALALRWSGGLETLSRAVDALGAGSFTRSLWSFGNVGGRGATLSHLIVRSTPREADTPEAFAAWARASGIDEVRLVELALYAPHWAAHVNHVLGWPGLESAVWWIQAHTKDDRSWQHQELKEIWAAEISERTPLSSEELLEGAVDVAWFHEAYGLLGPERWETVEAAAKYASTSAGHTRARLFAQAMTGRVDRDELVERIDTKRHQDSVRALGLLPLLEGEAGRRDVLERYEVLQGFKRGSRKFGSQRQQSEGRAVAIGLANLARTAGYRDPQRLQWAMEREAVADLAEGPVTVTRGDVVVQLAIDAEGEPGLTIRRGEKTLKSVPAALRKDAEITELRDRLQALRKQRSRVRDALEEAMCRGDRFTGAELRELLAHPILAPSLGRLVFVGDDVAGYLVEGGHALRDHTGALHAIGNDEPLRIAHPHDLFARGGWSAWQRECFRAERVQPFKQLFRELYPATDAERGTTKSRRYAGHQVNPRQALALLGGRGWVAHPEEGVSRTFHEEGLTARLYFQETFYTPADVEGLTLEEVVFTRKGEWKELRLGEVPARVFSEAMRDLDLVVAVAHQGGVDPEATASTVEMRAALVRETCELLGLGNVEVQANHAIVRGELATYSVHLGSAGVLILPGTSIPIVAVHSQHRGRLFLPFADDDPRTAEVLSKVLLLARDREIKDPTILERIRASS